MKINSITLRNFRNYDKETINFSPQSNILIGPNASGKTNILESVYVMSFSKSYKAKDEDLIKHRQDFFKVTVDTDDKEIVLIASKEGKRAEVNKVKIKKLTDFIGNLRVVLFSPDDILMFKNGPQERRNFLDYSLLQLSKSYVSNYQSFKKQLKLRNDYLKYLLPKVDIKGKVEDEMLDILTESFVESNKLIHKEREEFTKKLEEVIKKKYQAISASKDVVTIEYDTNFKDDLNFYKNKYNQDLITGTTNYGCHRDDLKFYKNKELFEKVASQGELRMLSIAIKLALCELIKEEKSDSPILLLDDVFSELDINHQNKLLESLDKETQIIITTTDLNEINKNTIAASKVFSVKNGEIKEISNGR